METIKPAHNHYRNRIQLDCSDPQLTDQSYKKQCDINTIMLQYQKTGLLPQQTTIPGQYIDTTLTPSLETAFEVTRNAIDAFYNLPPDIRRLMDNNPSQLESFILNKDNDHILKKHGIIIEQKLSEPQATLNDVIKTLKETSTKSDKNLKEVQNA